MAVFIKATYSKKLGLPQYSSHQYTVEVSSELTDVSQLPQASADLYVRLQNAVDAQIANPGFMPGENSQPGRAIATPASTTVAATQDEDVWKCSEKQRDLILKIVNEHGLEKTEIEKLAQGRYGTGVKQLNKLQASGLIDELLETYGKTENSRRGSFRQPASYGRNRR